MNEYHIPALATESVKLLNIKPKGIYVDITFGGGGHSALILKALGKDGRLYAFDQDGDAVVLAAKVEDRRFTFVASNFRWMRTQLRAMGIDRVDGIFADLGVSSHHFDTPERGFSFRFDAPLDMRMNAREGRSAADVVNGYDTDQLARVLRLYGEMEQAGRVAQLIVQARPVVTTADLVHAVAECTPRKDENRYLSRLFQALRIEVNGEMDALEMALEQSLKLLNTGGRLVVISYHSLEDRLVKNFMRTGNIGGVVKRDMIYGVSSEPLRALTRHAIVPTEAEIAANPRARSAKLRGAEKI